MGQAQPKMQRTFGHGRLVLKAGQNKTKLDQLYQEGAARIRLPKTYDDCLEAVMINTSGGLTGGDVMTWAIDAGQKSHGVVTTQACEKIYKSTGDVARVTTKINLEAGARLDWLPQETILFEHANLSRTLDVTLQEDARFMAVEAVMLGREASGEKINETTFQDRWRIRRKGKLIHADDLRIAGDIPHQQDASSLLNTNAAFASFIYCGPEDQDVLEGIVTKHADDIKNRGIGISAMSGKITARFLARDCYELRKILIPFLMKLRTSLGAGVALPKVWTI